MKQQLNKLIATTALILFALPGIAQKKSITAPWASDKGYWVVESSYAQAATHTIRFYSNEDVLFYTEKLEGVKFNPEQRRVKMKLKKILETSWFTWEHTGQPVTGKDYVAHGLR